MLEQETDKTVAKEFPMQISVRYFVKRINYGLIGLYVYVWPVGQLLLFIITVVYYYFAHIVTFCLLNGFSDQNISF